MKVIDLIKQQLVGLELEHRNKYGRTVSLKVEDVKLEQHSRQITASTPENDWWPETKEWVTIDIYFVDGSKIEVDLDYELVIRK